MAIKNIRTGEIIPDEERGLATYEQLGNGMLMPLASVQEAQAAIAAYEQLKSAIVRPDDIQLIQGRNFLKKSFWRRVAACFGLSLELVSEERLIIDGALAYRAIYRAVAPNGRTMAADGMCSTAETGHGGWPEHNVRATAHTRAKNRAISDMVGGGEVSAEEMPEVDGHAAPAAPRPSARPAPQPASKATTKPSPKPAAPASAQSPWKAMVDPDVQVLLRAMGYENRATGTAALGALKAYYDSYGSDLIWDRAHVLEDLRWRIKNKRDLTDVLEDEAKQEPDDSEWIVTPAGNNDPPLAADAADLAALPTGAPGN